jgi:isopentenyldiphosphate isomerase
MSEQNPAAPYHDPEHETLDLVDENGVRIGTATRDACHSNPELLHQAVHVFVFDRSGDKLLLQKRSKYKRIQPGRWDTSVGGHVDLGEEPLAAACRETEEELGFQPEKGLLEPIHRYLWHSDIESELISSYKYHYEGPFHFNENEIEQGRFFSFAEIEALALGGLLTPNLLHELKLLGWLSSPTY